LEQGIQDYRLPWVMSKQTQPDIVNVKDGSPDHIFHLLALFSVIRLFVETVF
jgi:hypothetical protein